MISDANIIFFRATFKTFFTRQYIWYARIKYDQHKHRQKSVEQKPGHTFAVRQAQSFRSDDQIGMINPLLNLSLLTANESPRFCSTGSCRCFCWSYLILAYQMPCLVNNVLNVARKKAMLTSLIKAANGCFMWKHKKPFVVWPLQVFRLWLTDKTNKDETSLSLPKTRGLMIE